MVGVWLDDFLQQEVQVFMGVMRPRSLTGSPGSDYVTSIASFKFPMSEMELVAGGFTMYAGQPDPHDGTRFTIDYDLNGQRHTLDGHLSDRDVLTIEERVASTTQSLPSSSGQSR
jgi:hypothetical protein